MKHVATLGLTALLFAGGLFIWLAAFTNVPPNVKAGSPGCPQPADYIGHLNTSPGDAAYEAALDVLPGPNAPFAKWVNILDLGAVITKTGPCAPSPLPTPTPAAAAKVAFYSKITTDGWWPSQQAVLDDYAMIHHWQCCQQYAQAFGGPALTYVDYYFSSTSGAAPYLSHPSPSQGMILNSTSGGYCLQDWFSNRWIGNVTDPAFRSVVVQNMEWLLANTATDGIYIDVAEAHLPNAADCPGTPEVTNTQWLDGWADLLEALDALSGPLVVNFQPSRWDNVQATNAADAERFFRAVDMVEVEHGWALGSSDAQSLSGWNDLVAKIDYAHRFTSVFTWEYDDGHNQCGAEMTAQQERYSLAMWFITWADGDHYGTFSNDGRECGDAFSPLYRTDLGAPLGPRVSCGSGCYQREFEAGTVTADVTTKVGVLP